ncbi:MAG: hypothetical protein EZS28_020603 [Streblomastix strix]|uniref:HNH nuclease domain-containing protein n=1 Tax=Streblomastix strix TaxID=222440 RepID=A0A5J4VNH4_9EUKA|nr:MAG: hypothetical protein EZS28_020603 [Streblomastix strix]
MTFLDKYIIDKESAQDKMSRVNYEKQRQGYEPIKDYPRYLINDQLTVWDTKLYREVNPQSKKSRSGGLIGRQIRLNDINGKRCDLSFSYLVAKQFIPNEDINKNKIFHLDNDLENDAVDNLLWIDQFNYNRYNTNKVLGDYYVLDEAQNVWFNNLDNDTYMELKQTIMGKSSRQLLYNLGELEEQLMDSCQLLIKIPMALQFILNDDPEHKTQCDHVSHIKSDNSLDEESIVVNEYGNYQFEDLYFHDDVFYFFNGLKFKQLHINQSKGGSHFVHAKDINDKVHKIYYTKFKRFVGLI